MSRAKSSFKQTANREEQLQHLRSYGVAVHPEGSRWRVERGSCAGVLEVGPDGLRIAEPSALRIGNELGQLLDGGYQKFFKTPTRKVPATADQLLELHEFNEALSEALGSESLYNLSLGTVSTTYHYDRVKGRANP